MPSGYLMRPVRTIDQVRAERERNRKPDRLAAFASYRAEFADLARFKMRQAKGEHIRYSPQTERVVELLSDWAASFA